MSDKVRVLEGRVRELERAVETERRAGNEATRALYRRDRLIKELTLQADTHKAQAKDLQTQVDNLQSQLNIYRRKYDHVEEVGLLNQERFRKVHKMYLEECGRTEEFAQQLRRKRAVDERTGLFHQAL